MCPEVYQTFAKLLASTGVGWGEDHRVLEVGAMDSDDTLLTLPLLADTQRIGITRDSSQATLRCCRQWTILGPGWWNWRRDMVDESADLVLCNSVLEHDPKFWLALSEMRRVLKPGGWLAVGAPSFSERLDAGPERTITMERHDFPADYYRFSPAMFHEVVFGGFEQVTVLDIMDPPRCVGIGRKP